MAEFPDVGKHCALSSCQKLDFTPHLCPHCEKHFCGDHRLSHGCLDAAATAPNGEPPTSNSAAPLRPHLCAKNGCFNRESVKIVCSHCSQNFCLSHRHAEDHECKYHESINDVENRQKEAVKKEIMAKLAPKQEKIAAPATKKTKVLSVAEQKKMDRIEAMRLKSNVNPTLGIPKELRMVIFAKVFEPEERRVPILIHMRWTVGRCLDKIASDLKIINDNGVTDAKKLRLYKDDGAEPLTMSDNILDHFGVSDLSTVILKRDL